MAAAGKESLAESVRVQVGQTLQLDFQLTGTARVEQIVTGTLVVDMLDATTKAMLWRGIASNEIDAKAKPEDRDKKANKAAAKLFKKYPPQHAE